jgi:hypothetical protein
MKKKYLLRFNRSRGEPGRGSWDHAWRVFDGPDEYLVKHVKILVPCESEHTQVATGQGDWNIAVVGEMTLDHESSTAIFH